MAAILSRPHCVFVFVFVFDELYLYLYLYLIRFLPVYLYLYLYLKLRKKMYLYLYLYLIKRIWPQPWLRQYSHNYYTHNSVVKNTYSPCQKDSYVQISIGNTEWLLRYKGVIKYVLVVRRHAFTESVG